MFSARENFSQIYLEEKENSAPGAREYFQSNYKIKINALLFLAFYVCFKLIFTSKKVKYIPGVCCYVFAAIQSACTERDSVHESTV